MDEEVKVPGTIEELEEMLESGKITETQFKEALEKLGAHSKIQDPKEVAEKVSKEGTQTLDNNGNSIKTDERGE